MVWWTQTLKPFIVLELRAIVQLLPAAQRHCFLPDTFTEHPQTRQLVFLRPGAKGLLGWFKDNGYPMVLFTQCTRQEIDVALEATGIPEAWFVLVVDASSPIFEAAGGSPPGLKDLSQIHPYVRSDQCILLDTSADHRCFEGKGGQRVQQFVCQLPPFEPRTAAAAAEGRPPDIVLIRQHKALARQSREEDKAVELLRIMTGAVGPMPVPRSPNLTPKKEEAEEDKKRPAAFLNLSIQMSDYLTPEESSRTPSPAMPALRTGNPSSLSSSMTNSPVCPQDQRSLSLSMCTPIGRSGPRAVTWADNLVTDLEEGAATPLKRINSFPNGSILKDGIQRTKFLPAMKSLQGPARFLAGSEIATATLTQLPVSAGLTMAADHPPLCPGMMKVTLQAVLAAAPANLELDADASVAQAFEVLAQADVFGCMLLNDDGVYVGMVDVNDLALAIVQECQAQVGSNIDKPWFELAKILQPQSTLFLQAVSQFVSSLPTHSLYKVVPRFTHDTPLLTIIEHGFLSKEATAIHQLPVLIHGTPRMLSSFDIISYLASNPDHLGKQGGATLQELGLAKKDVLTVSQETPAVEAVYQMDRQRVSALAIVDVDGKFAGAISIEDFRGFVANDLPLLALPVTRFLNTRRRPPRQGGGGGSARCSGRSANLWSATSAVTLAEAVARLAPKTVTHLFVVNKLSRPASVVSPTDILRVLTSKAPASPTT